MGAKYRGVVITLAVLLVVGTIQTIPLRRMARPE
jgi:hypothetical protein